METIIPFDTGNGDGPGQPTVAHVVDALDRLTGGRIHTPPGVANPWAVTKDSGIGKAVTEHPGLVCGRSDKRVGRLAIAMTISEQDIELANATGVDAIVAHHPVADAASAGGVTLVDYLGLYDLAVIECHEAFHGLHPGIAHLHGHEPYRIDPAYDGSHGRVIMVGRPVAGVTTLADILGRLEGLLGRSLDRRILAAEATARDYPGLVDSATAPGMRILVGDPDTPIGEAVLHAFPHTGFGPDQLVRALAEHPEVGTVVFSISGARPDSPVVELAAERGVNVVVGSLHASEIVENGLPLGFALDALLPEVEVVVFRERVVALPLAQAAPGPLGDYGRRMAADHLLGRAPRDDGDGRATPAAPPLTTTIADR
jgi:hypothetical protein